MAGRGPAALDQPGRLLEVVDAGTDEELLAWLAPYTTEPCLVAIDAPPDGPGSADALAAP